MSNLTIENLDRMIQTGDLDTYFGKSAQVEHRKRMTEEGGASSVTQTATTEFSNMLKDYISEVNTSQVQADQAISSFLAGRTKNPHEAMLAIEKADLSLKMMVQVRNKVLDAYREIMRMQV